MFVHIEILDARGSLAGLGSHKSDQVVVRLGRPPSPRSVQKLPAEAFHPPIIGQPKGIVVPSKVAADMKRELTKKPQRQDPGAFRISFNVTKHDGEHSVWMGSIFVQTLCLANGYVADRWVTMKPAPKIKPGALRLRLLLRASEEDAAAVLKMNYEIPAPLMQTKGCQCELCDPSRAPTDEEIEKAAYDKAAWGASTAYAGCTIS